MRKILSNNRSDFSNDFVQYECSFSTAEIESSLFHQEVSPDLCAMPENEIEGEFRLIGDELMKFDRQNFPPGAFKSK